uniref:Uncharacterized protein n=1 Tax=Oryza glumipatula TaxID=40148 RepID=A0A0D9Y2M5_9ORYZ
MSSGRVGDRIAARRRRRDPTTGPESPPLVAVAGLPTEQPSSSRRGRVYVLSPSRPPREPVQQPSPTSSSAKKLPEPEPHTQLRVRGQPVLPHEAVAALRRQGRRRRRAGGVVVPPPADNEFTVRIDGVGADDGIFQCDGCFAMLSSPIYECANGDVICERCSYDDGGAREMRDDVARPQPRHRPPAPVHPVRVQEPQVRVPVVPPAAGHGRARALVRPRALLLPDPPLRLAGAADSLARHLTARHGWGRLRVAYGEAAVVPVQSPTILRADDGRISHLSCTRERGGGTAMSMVCIRPDHVAGAEEEFTYEVRTACQRLQMQAAVEGTSLRYGMKDAVQARVTVPDDMLLRQGDVVTGGETIFRRSAEFHNSPGCNKNRG